MARNSRTPIITIGCVSVGGIKNLTFLTLHGFGLSAGQFRTTDVNGDPARGRRLQAARTACSAGMIGRIGGFAANRPD